MSISSTGNLQRMIRAYQEVSKRVVDVGIVELAFKHKNGKTVQMAVVMRTQEEGSAKNNVPVRATMKPGVKEAKYQPRVKNLVTNIAVGNGLIGLDKIGEVASLKIKSNMQGLKDPPLKPATIANRINKGTTNPLVDSSELKKSIDFKVNKK